MTKAQIRASALTKHYATCERMGVALGMKNPNGRKISTMLFLAEKLGTIRGERLCSDSEYTRNEYARSEGDKASVVSQVTAAFGGKLPPGFFVNSDPRGYALRIDHEMPEGKAFIEAVGMEKDWGGYGILSPEL